MKKRIIFFCVILTLFLLYGCVQSNMSNMYKDTWTTYTLSSKTSHAFFSASPEDSIKKICDSKWVGGHYRDASVDEEGNLILTLSKDDIAHWKEEITNDIKKVMESSQKDRDGGYTKINDNYHYIECKVQREYNLAAGFEITEAAVDCGIMQMLNGEDANCWKVDITIIDLDTGRIVSECKGFPEEKLHIGVEEWEKIINKKE